MDDSIPPQEDVWSHLINLHLHKVADPTFHKMADPTSVERASHKCTFDKIVTS